MIYLLWPLHYRSTFSIYSRSTVNSGTLVIWIGAIMWSPTEICPVRSLHHRFWINVQTFKIHRYPVMGPGLLVVHSHSVVPPLLTLRSGECEQSWADIWVPWPLHHEFQIDTLIYSQPPHHHSYIQNHGNIFVLHKTGFRLQNLEVLLYMPVSHTTITVITCQSEAQQTLCG